VIQKLPTGLLVRQDAHWAKANKAELNRNIPTIPHIRFDTEISPKNNIDRGIINVTRKVIKKTIREASHFTNTRDIVDTGKVSEIPSSLAHKLIVREGIYKIEIYGIKLKKSRKSLDPLPKIKKLFPK
jgi:hypothetical protein